MLMDISEMSCGGIAEALLNSHLLRVGMSPTAEYTPISTPNGRVVYHLMVNGARLGISDEGIWLSRARQIQKGRREVEIHWDSENRYMYAEYLCNASSAGV